MVRWNWIISRRADLGWFIGSALAGWLYVALVLLLGRGLQDPLREPLHTVTIGGASFALTLNFLVYASWAYLVDSPHLWATFSRTLVDPDEWARRRRELMLSFSWFAAGPVAVLGPYLVGVAVPLSAAAMALGGRLFYAFFRLWAYYHVARQHWGFLVLYERKNGDPLDSMEKRADFWFFNLALYLPLLWFASSPWHPEAALPRDSGISGEVLRRYGIGGWLYPLSLSLYWSSAAAYVVYQIARWRAGAPRNGPKLLLLLSIVPLHYVVFAEPLLAFFVVPAVTVGHNLQYHRIVWMYGKNKYARAERDRYRWAKPIFQRPWLYVLLAIAFTFGLNRGPWISFLYDTSAFYFDRWIFHGIGVMAGLADPAAAGVGAEVAGLFFAGWSMQHYYLDAKIWHVRRDSALAGSLAV